MSRKSKRKLARKAQTKGKTLDQMLADGEITQEAFDEQRRVMLMDGPEFNDWYREKNPKHGIVSLLDRHFPGETAPDPTKVPKPQP